jgi:transcriptional regulator with XRE-family HTH domain
MKFGDILRTLLEERELSQKQLAVELKVLAPSLGRYIRNEREPDFETLKHIAGYFNVSTDFLLDYRTNQTVSRNEDNLLRIFRALSEDQQEVFVEQAKAVLAHNNKKVKSSESKTTDRVS